MESEVSYIPHEAEWYIAGLVEEITIEDEPRNIVHKNLVLIRAGSPEIAYQNALELGHDSEVSYENPAGKLVRIKFRGLSDLNVIHDELDHGAELLYEERIGVPNEDIERWIFPKERLSAFRPQESTKEPDYSAKEILDEAKRLIGDR